MWYVYTHTQTHTHMHTHTHIHTMENYSTIEKNEIIPWMEKEIIIPSPTKKDKYYIILLICEVKKHQE